MPPKISLLQFNRIISISKRFLNTFAKDIEELSTLSGNQCRSQAEYLNSSLRAELDDFNSAVAPYLASEALVEGLVEETLQEAVSELKGEFNHFICLVSRYLTPHVPLASSTQIVDTSVASVVQSPMIVPFNLKKFNGEYADFDSFIARFETLIDSSTQMTTYQKFECLLGYLEGKALDIVCHFPFTEKNYKSALDLLKERFSNSRRTLSLHANKILSLPKMNNTASSIRDFLDQHSVHFASLENAVKDVKVQEVIYVHYLLSKFPTELRDKFETSACKAEPPTLAKVLGFLQHHVKGLENATLGIAAEECSSPSNTRVVTTNKTRGFKGNKRSNDSNVNKSFSSLSTSLIKSGCYICSSLEHKVVNCNDLLKLSPRDRFKLVKSKQLCARCLFPVHKGKCKVTNVCEKCESKGHHSLLHFPTEDLASVPVAEDSQVSLSCHTTQSIPQKKCVLMATALVRLQVSATQYIVARAILDTASHASFVSERVAQALGCKRFFDDCSISGIGRSSTVSRGVCSLSVCDIAGHVMVRDQQFLILPHITLDTPREFVHPSLFDKLKGFVLADPTFNIPSPAEVLLGADVVSASLLGTVVSLGEGMPVVLLSSFGAVLMGSAPSAPACDAGSSNVAAVSQTCSPRRSHAGPVISLVTGERDLLEMVHKFWSVEEPPPVPKLSSQELKCEKYFQDTTCRLESGRYQVRLPFVDGGKESLGDSYDRAWSRLRSLERRFRSDLNFKELYVQFMSDYVAQGHMFAVDNSFSPLYFIPHHGIYKKHGDRSKLRVVFDASAKSDNGSSLNSVLLDAPNKLALLADVLTLFRRHSLVLTCDVEQMYRQIRVHPEDMTYQCILWREDENLPVRIYALATVTYGVGPAAYLAISTLRRLAKDEEHRFPKAAHVLLRNTFMDDISAGEETEKDLISLRNELISLLSAGGFKLKKWASNCPSVLSDLPGSDCLPLQSQRVLGFVWNSDSDVLKFPVEEMISEGDTLITKRNVLAQTAKLFDPCGYLSPLIMYAKIFFQNLWRLSLDWDSPIPLELQDQWTEFKNKLKLLHKYEIPRPLGFSSFVQIHGFSDACQSGYAAVLYLRVQTPEAIFTNLIASKTRVAPLRSPSIPRLELLGAHLLARLCKHYVDVLSTEYSFSDIILWSDSSIVLDWIHIEPHLLKTFAANRVAEILEWTDIDSWRHVPGVLNYSADIASRGVVKLSDLDTSEWLHGPSFLKLDSHSWPSSSYVKMHIEKDLELKSPVLASCASTIDQSLFDRVSSWSMAVKVMMCLVRWFRRKEKGFVSAVRVRETALLFLAKHIQWTSFSKDIVALRGGKFPNPAIQRLAPFIDDKGVLRVKGRLANISPPSRPCPILLPKHHHLVHLLIEHYHRWLGHAGPSQVQYQLSWSYWILSARQVIRQIVHRCVKCCRAAPRPSYPLMGDLPAIRVNPSPPFWYTGMDFCGPFKTKVYSLRKAPMVKSYLCIFICLSTKAVHLEVALDLSAQAFIDVLKRFISRRGIPCCLYSDCGTNFIGTRSILQKELKRLLSTHSDSQIIREYLLSNSIDFRTIVPSGPHQGGIWERAVRSAKFHLKRIVGCHVLTFSQFMTLSVLIESILNSRPLTPMSADPGDYSPLTPAHFLVGRPLTIPPEEDLTSLQDGSLKHYQLIRSLFQRFWKKWRVEYLTTLQSRSKWYKNVKNLNVGDLVVVEEPNCPPLLWPLGRICAVHPGKDGVVRRVTVKTSNGEYDRPSTKIYCLPINADPIPDATK